MNDIIEFKIESLPNNEFRIPKLDPVEVLAFSMTVNFEKIKQNLETMNFALEHTEVKMADKWVQVKQTDKKVYMPMGIENNFKALREVAEYFMNEVLSKVF